MPDAEQEMADNERMWREEKGTDQKPAEGEGGVSAALGDAGITSSGIEDMAPDDGFEEPESDELDTGDLDFENSTDEVAGFGE